MRYANEKIIDALELIRARNDLNYFKLKIKIIRSFIQNQTYNDIYEETRYREDLRVLPNSIQNVKKYIESLEVKHSLDFSKVESFEEILEVI